jgi:hypothetical protein
MMRVLQGLPGLMAIILIGILLSGYGLFPTQLAVALLAFDLFWLWKSWTVMIHAVKGYRMIRENETRDWRAEYDAAQFLRAVPWEDVRHVVIIPNYKESPEKLRATLTAMAAAEGARECVIPVLAMEEAEPDSQAKGDALYYEFRDHFAEMFVTSHPIGLKGEIRGKSSNQAWAVRRVVEELVDHRGYDMDAMTVTSCDADTIFPRPYFSALTFYFATDPRRYRRFWQAPIFFYNNIWQVPAPLRVPNALAGLVHLARLSRQRRVLFSQSTYTLSMRMAHDVGYWDTDIIPEDWHMFLKCYYHFSGTVEVQPIHLMLGNDGALSRTPKETAINHYQQVRRWAWGASDVPYVFNQAAMHPEIPFGRRFLRCWYVLENHILWSTQWFYITLGGFIPIVLARSFGVEVMPDWFSMLARIILTPCLAFYIILIILDHKLRPAPPKSVTPYVRVASMVHWILLPPVSFFASCLPALDSQIRLLFNRRMEYRVTEKI